MDTPDLSAAPIGSVVAPAGCGKTEEIIRLVKAIRGKPALVLTHTNAGVAALQSRMKTAGIQPGSYRLYTIDAWSQRIVRAFPLRSGLRIDPLSPPQYQEIKVAALRVLQSGAIDQPLKATYGCVLVDEYQDCGTLQHTLVVELSKHLPVRIFGDPMQAIFNFNGPVVDWRNVETTFPPLPRLSTPWRWKQKGSGKMGEWLLDARAVLERGADLNLASAPSGYVHWVELDNSKRTQNSEVMRAVHMKLDERLLIIGHTTTAAIRHDFARKTPGVDIVERADLPDLMKYAAKLEASPVSNYLDIALTFAGEVMTKVDIGPLKKRLESIKNNESIILRSHTNRHAWIFTPTLLPNC